MSVTSLAYASLAPATFVQLNTGVMPRDRATTVRKILENWNRDLLSDEYIDEDVPSEFLDKQWLGYAPASENLISEHERRLGVDFPASYREFLKISNGWVYPGSSYDFPGEIRPVERVEWARDGESDVAEAFSEDLGGGRVSDKDYFIYGDEQDPVYMRREYIEHCLLISDETEGGVFLLNPMIKTEDGEWEAWHLGSEIPGAYRTRSFVELLEFSHKMLLHFRGE